MHFCSSESRESRIFGISALKTIVLKNKTKLFFDLQLVNYFFIFFIHFGQAPPRRLGLGGLTSREILRFEITEPSKSLVFACHTPVFLFYQDR